MIQPDSELRIHAGEVIDPVDGTLGPSTITLRGGLIAAIDPGFVGDADSAIDLRSETLLPGLIDAHVHLNLPGDGSDPQASAEAPETHLAAISVLNAQTALAAGITTVRDIGSKGTSVFHARSGAKALDRPLPRMLVAGAPVTITGGHCWFFGGEADGIDGVRRRVRELVKAGADWIKVMATGGGTAGSRPAHPSYSADELRAIVDEAHSRGVKVTAHCLSAEGMRRAVAAGVDHIEHAGFTTDTAGEARYEPAVADLLAEAGTVVTPTLSVRAFARDAQAAAGAPAKVVDGWQRKFDNGMDQFARLVAAGVRFAAGTDAGWHFTPFDGLAEEIALIAECGVSALASLRSATSATAEHFELPPARLRPGARADLLAVAGDPLRDLRALGRVRLVFREGRIITPLV